MDRTPSPWFVFGSYLAQRARTIIPSLVFDTEYIYEVQGMRILIFVLYEQKKRIVECAF